MAALGTVRERFPPSAHRNPVDANVDDSSWRVQITASAAVRDLSSGTREPSAAVESAHPEMTTGRRSGFTDVPPDTHRDRRAEEDSRVSLRRQPAWHLPH